MSLELILKKVEVYKKKLVRIQAKVVAWVPTSVTFTELETVNGDLQNCKEKLEDLYEQLNLKCSPDDIKDNESLFESVFQSCNNYIINVGETKRAKEAATTSSATSPSFKLERIKLPHFNGKFEEWQEFHDLFQSAVHKSTLLSKSEKMVHLKSSLTGEAASIVASFPTTDASYQEAWDLVCKRYNNKREIVFAHIRKLDELKPVQESSSGLRKVIDTVNECVRSLKVLKIPVQHWDLIIIYFSLKKVDPESRKMWLLTQDGSLPILEDFITYLENRSSALTDSTCKPKSYSPHKSSHHTSGINSYSCYKCTDSHPLYKCKEFNSMSVPDRQNLVKKNSLCYNCLFKGHSSNKCKTSTSCKSCGKRHHSLLHFISKSVEVPSTSTPSPNSLDSSRFSYAPQNSTSTSSPAPQTSSSHCMPKVSNSQVALLGTLLVCAEDRFGERKSVRVFVDPGSESHFISEFCVDRLGLERKKSCISVGGIGGVIHQRTKGLAKVHLFSRVNSFHVEINAFILPKVTGLLPRSVCQSTWNHIKGLELGDPEFFKPGHVDILIGIELASRIMLPDIRHGPLGTPSAQNTKFGWLLSGSVSQKTNSFIQVSSHHSSCVSSEPCLESTLIKFWNIEEPEQFSSISKEEEACEQFFISTHQRLSNGSYSVQLPFITKPSFGDSRQQALRRFSYLENRFSRDSWVKEEYTQEMRKYISSGFMEEIPAKELATSTNESYYIPHHAVVKESSSTTKVRIVFDASAKTTNGLSLNDQLMKGPKIQSDLVPILIRFRSHLIAMSADIKKFFNQYSIQQNHVNYQRLLWRESPDQQVKDYHFPRLLFGVTSSPYLATRCLHQLADDEKHSYPGIHRILTEDFLVDNLLSGAANLQQALDIQRQILQVMSKGNLQLLQWSSNNSLVTNSVPENSRQNDSSCTIMKDEESIRTIGILWYPSSDYFGIIVHKPENYHSATKRQVLSTIARVFDPLGWLSPVTIKPKVLLQEIWKSNLSWDSPLPSQLLKQWTAYCKELELLQQFRIPRCLIAKSSSSNSHLELHGYCDASLIAYSACVYLRTVLTNSDSTVILVTAKSKVSPVKGETIPRLELCSAVLLAKLMNSVLASLHLDFSVIRFWTDSMIVLGWLSTEEKLPIFINNRVRKILSLFPNSKWAHVSGEENPADPASRGISANSLLNHPLWLNGPRWLYSASFASAEEVQCHHSNEQSSLLNFINNCSSYLKLQRVVAYATRFINMKVKRIYLFGSISIEEMKNALFIIIKLVQRHSFQNEIAFCERNLMVKSSIKFLTPFLDDKGLLRVGGRLRNAQFGYDQKHPILLPKSHNFTTALVRHYHNANLHPGNQLLLAIIREKFWIIRGLDVIRKVTKTCIRCHRQNPTTLSQLMGQLPTPRVNQSRPFAQSGVDFAGPFFLAVVPGRRPQILKFYVAVFVCMAVKAIHLELVGDLSAESFKASLIRFISRRGVPADIYCDGGKNFEGTKNEMEEIRKFLNSDKLQQKASSFATEKGFVFHFNPPYSPHHGGIWEAGVKSMKHHLRRIIDNRHLSIEEFSTLLCQIEALLNSRPLTALSSDPNDYSALTPAHFLIGDTLSSIPQVDITDVKPYRLSRWQIIQQLQQHFWKRWRSEYLHQLQQSKKWLEVKPNLKVGTLVLVHDEDSKFGPAKWNLARVMKVNKGPDGHVRVCEVKFPNGTTYKRPIVKISPLPFED